MYLRISAIVSGDESDYFDQDSFPFQKENEPLPPSPGTMTLLPHRGVKICRIPREAGFAISFYKTSFKMLNDSCVFFKFDIEASGFDILEDGVNHFEFQDFKFDLLTSTLTFPKGQKTNISIVDLNLPQGFHNDLTISSIVNRKFPTELMSDHDLLIMSLLSQPFYPAEHITVDYVQLARNKMIEKGFMDPGDFEMLDDEFKFINEGEVDRVDVLKL